MGTVNGIGVPLAFSHSKKDYHRVIAKKIEFHIRPLPENKRIPLSWNTFVIKADGAQTTLKFGINDFKEMIIDKVYLRLTTAMISGKRSN